jgi:hypothetical protein
MNCANHPERERIAFCQNCGKPLCQECARTVGTAVFCEPCLEARLAGTTTPPPASSGAWTSYPGGSGDPHYTAAGAIPPPPAAGAPNPGLAALLGFIPGVGAMYNGQYAKGVVHLIIFAVLVSLTDEHGIFGLFVAGWVFYQVFEAYQTASARRDATPLPNPFGLNDLGERLGFGRSWPAGAASSSTAPPPPVAEAPPVTSYAPPAAGYPPPTAGYPPPPAAGYPPPGATWGAPTDTYSGSPYTSPYAVPFVAPVIDPNATYPRNRFPAGAIWLIGLGAIFLIGNTGLFHGFRVDRLFPFFLIGLGVWLFVHKMTSSGATLSDDGTAFYRMRLFGALRGSIWVILVGIMFLLSSFNILSWGRSWPLFIIVAGIMILAEKTAYHPGPVPPAYPVPPVPPPASASIVPPAQDNSSNQEGR